MEWHLRPVQRSSPEKEEEEVVVEEDKVSDVVKVVFGLLECKYSSDFAVESPEICRC